MSNFEVPVCLDAFVGVYERYLQVVAASVKNGSVAVPDGFAQFFGMDGDGAEWQKFRKGVGAGWQLAVGGAKDDVLLCSGDTQGGPAGESDGVVESSCGESRGEDCGVGVNTLRNRVWRQQRKDKKARRKAGESVVGGTGESVPEWRQKGVRAAVHASVFADCSDDVKRELRDTRAKMLIAKNKAETLRMEHEQRRTAARLKARLVEQEVETKRLREVADYDALVKARVAKWPKGYAETLLSAGVQSLADVDLPELSAGSVSPDSSISVAELKRKNDALLAMTARISELESQLKNKKSAVSKIRTRDDVEAFFQNREEADDGCY